MYVCMCVCMLLTPTSGGVVIVLVALETFPLLLLLLFDGLTVEGVLDLLAFTWDRNSRQESVLI